jgi:hypothetical protein
MLNVGVHFYVRQHGKCTDNSNVKSENPTRALP